MASAQSCKRSVSNGKASLLCNDNDFGKGAKNRIIVERMVGESSLQRDFEDLSVSRRLVRSISHKLKKKSHISASEEQEGNERRVSSGCLGLYGKGGGCKVVADTCGDFGDEIGRRKSSAGEEGIMGYQPICGIKETRVDCFSYGVTEMIIRKKNNKKEKKVEEQQHPSNITEFTLPDDILELCLVRLPLTTLMTSRLVCKKWRYLTSTLRFMKMRCEGLYRSPWLFLFGVVKDGYCAGKIHALDVSLDQWHRIDANILKGRFLFSIACIGDEVYVVGGCSSLTNYGRVDKSSFKTHKGVLVFNPLTRSWRKVASMNSARSSPVLGVFEARSDSLIFRSQQERQDRHSTRSRVGGVSDVYEDPHRLSLRRQLRNDFNENEALVESNRKLHKFVDPRKFRRYVLIAVGGLGSWDEPLDTGEIYDPVSNKWIEITRLPGDFGVVCSGAVCNGMFYVYSEINKLAVYDIERCMWIGIQTAQSPPRLHEYYPKLISCNNRLFLLSVSWCEDGQLGRREKAVRKLWELDFMLLTWTEVSRHPDAPMDGNATFVADRGQIFGVEMFKIFGQVLDFVTVFSVSNPGSEWNRISRKHMAHDLDALSCMTKSLAVLHL